MLDARIFSFGKYSLPKTNSIIDSKQDCTIGYFDLVSVKEVTPDLKYESTLDQLLMGFFNQTHEGNDDTKKISEQNLFAFTNKSDVEFFEPTGYSFSEEKLNMFWESTTTFNSFFSLMHIECSSAEEIYGIINWLNYIFNDSSHDKYNAVFYFSFDYSDIILCAKNMSISEFTKKLFDVNYCKSQEHTVKNFSHCIKDSFSILTFNRIILQKVFDIIENNDHSKYTQIETLIKKEIEKTEYNFTEEKLNIVYNIGVQNFETFNKFIEDLSSIGIKFNKFAMLGRHDITINKPDSDIVWFIFLLYFVDKYTTCSEENEKDNLLFNCEAFVRSNIDFDLTYVIPVNQKRTPPSPGLKRYETARNSIGYRINKITNPNNENSSTLISQAQKNSLLSLYKSIESTLKNGFAEDFVICLYEPFIALLDYLDEKICEKNKQNVKEFDKVINRFFEIVTSLVNSAMHSDRQFIQTPSFNPVFFDVPPKLMAFYTSQTNKIRKINGYNDKNKYSFIFKPSLNRDITVFPYSYNQAPPTDRLLAVSINEESLYHPTKVLKVLCHEASHFVGNTKRCREIRKSCWIKSILFCTFELILSNLDIDVKNDTRFYSSISELIFNIFKIIEKDLQYKNHTGYSENINLLVHHIFKLISVNEDADEILNVFFSKKYRNHNVSALKNQFKKAILVLDEFVPISNEIELNTDWPIAKKFHKTYKTLLNAYKESYADIQMILLLDLSLEDYIKNLVLYEKMDYEHFTNDIAYYRIFPVVYTLVMLGIWDFPTNTHRNAKKSDFDKIIEQAKKYMVLQYKEISIKSNTANNEAHLESLIKTFLNEIEDDFTKKKTPYVTYSIVTYLDAVVKETQESFKEENTKDDKDTLVSLTKTIFNSTDSVKLFYCVQNINEEYLNNIIEYNE